MTNLYETFNARNYTPGQVAATFITNPDYEDLWRNEHTVVLGPRGSGKTTLFKMLTVQALYSWDTAFAKGLRNRRPFTAIYVPTDMHWHHQLKHAQEHLIFAPKFSNAASRAAVTTSVLLAVAKTFQDRLAYESPSAAEKETELCKALFKEWLLPQVLPLLDLVTLGLKSRIAEIRRLINQVAFQKLTDPEIHPPDYFHLDYFASMDVACSWFDSLFKLTQSPKWALCFDELELAPPWLQSLAFSQQRSSEEKYLVKLSTSPLPSMLGTTEARPKQDLRLIAIWNYPGRRSDDFAENLARSVLSRRLERNVSPQELFGTSELILQAEEGVEKYTRGSAEWRLFRDLSAWDPSVKTLLTRAGLDPADPFTSDISIRDSLLRKAKPVAVLRSAFLKPQSHGRVSLRSRKLATIYFGKEAIYRVSDGNPRRLIGILGDLAAKVTCDDAGNIRRLAPNEQAEVIERASKQFQGYVHALPEGTVVLGEHTLDLATLVKAIGTYFRQRLLGPEFPLDPVGSFRVDSNLNDKVVELLRLGVYHGAIVHVDPVPDTIETSLRGKRFRLSYMLAPSHRLPLTLYEPVSLSLILRSSQRLRVKRALPEMVQQQELGFTASTQ
jgi:hypothetical protein